MDQRWSTHRTGWVNFFERKCYCTLSPLMKSSPSRRTLLRSLKCMHTDSNLQTEFQLENQQQSVAIGQSRKSSTTVLILSYRLSYYSKIIKYTCRKQMWLNTIHLNVELINKNIQKIQMSLSIYIYIYIYCIYIYIYIHTHTHTHIQYIYIYIYTKPVIRVDFSKLRFA